MKEFEVPKLSSPSLSRIRNPNKRKHSKPLGFFQTARNFAKWVNPATYHYSNSSSCSSDAIMASLAFFLVIVAIRGLAPPLALAAAATLAFAGALIHFLVFAIVSASLARTRP